MAWPPSTACSTGRPTAPTPSRRRTRRGSRASSTSTTSSAAPATYLVANPQAQPWSGDYVSDSGNLGLDLPHNFFLESGARTHKARERR